MRSWQEEVKFLRRKNSIQIVKDQRLPLWLAALVAGSRRKRNVKSQFLFNTVLLDSCLLHSGLLHSLAFQHGQLARKTKQHSPLQHKMKKIRKTKIKKIKKIKKMKKIWKTKIKKVKKGNINEDEDI